MQQQEQYKVHELPGTGELVRAREGTALSKALGAASYWKREHDRVSRRWNSRIGVCVGIGIIVGAALAEATHFAVARLSYEPTHDRAFPTVP